MSREYWMADSPRLNEAIRTRRREAWEAVTNDRKPLMAAVHAYRHALADDGWEVLPTYSHEPVERAWRARRDGFIISGLCRTDEDGRPEGCPEVCGWGPDGLAINIPKIYSFAAISAATQVCGVCGAEGVKTERVAFANRACASCSPALRRELETPGWNK